MDGAALYGLLGTLAGAVTTLASGWLGQRIQLRRESDQRVHAERNRWTDEKRQTFRAIHSSANDWVRLLRRVSWALISDSEPGHLEDEIHEIERSYHKLTYETDLLAGREVRALVDEVEDRLLDVTCRLGISTDHGLGTAQQDIKEAAHALLNDNFQQVRDARLQLMAAMRRELARSSGIGLDAD
ncbi:hypothetical protein [Actinoallomurus sp. CA-150999]|uniref:hypothetical protein n=1 Tax=Actinoallomurus sp. CA-150999 TaxID=3239887 RepID=UPI003D8C63FD